MPISAYADAPVSTKPLNKDGGLAGQDLRLDIQGLRAIAVGIVLLYHAGFGWIPGGFVGVDVFFVISGFLITGGIVREIRRTGRLSLAGFWGRRAARILPAATVALVGIVVLSYLLLPITRWLQVGGDAMASGLYIVNWDFANSAVDYLANDQAPSPLQHFWSLAVEEQFYVVWPLVLVAAAAIAQRRGARRTIAFGVALAVVAIPSLLWSIYLTSTNPGAAYFVTTTRMWELAIGAGLALFATLGSKTPKPLAAIIGWIGVGAIAVSAATYTTSVPFPSFTAALPTLGAAMIIWAGPMAGRLGPVAFLGMRPMVAVGTVSYSLYLWHWPMLVLAGAMFGSLSPVAGLLVVALSFLPAWASLRFVERPVLAWSKKTREKSSLKIGGILSLTAITAGAVLAAIVPPVPPTSDIEFVSTQPQRDAVEVPPVGAEVLLKDISHGNPQDAFPTITPNALAAPSDVPKTCLQSEQSQNVVKCSFGNAGSSTVIAMVGDSHAAMYVPGVAAAALEKGWRLDVYTKGSCPFTTAVVLLDGQPYDNCLSWGDKVSEAVMSQPPTALIVGSSQYTAAGFDDKDESMSILVEGMRNRWQPFIESGIPVISLRDAPNPGMLVPDCVAENETSLGKCAMPKKDILRTGTPEVEATYGLEGSHHVDLTDAMCPGELCPAVIGGIQVYRDSNHITATYARTMHGQIATALESIIGPI